MTFSSDTFEGRLKDAIANGATDPEFEPDDGTYAVTVHTTSTEITGQGKELAKLRLKVIDGADAGRVFDHTLFFTTQFATEQSVRALASYGVSFADVTGLDELDRAMEQVRGATAEVRVTHDGDFVRVVVLGCAPPPAASENGAPPVPVAADSEPTPF